MAPRGLTIAGISTNPLKRYQPINRLRLQQIVMLHSIAMFLLLIMSIVNLRSLP